MSMWKDSFGEEPGGNGKGGRRATEAAAAQIQMRRPGQWGGTEADQVERDLEMELTGPSG